MPFSNRGESRLDALSQFVVMTVIDDAELRLYVEDCLSRMPDVRLTDSAGPPRPKLIVTDRSGIGFEVGLAGIPRLHVLDEPPAPGSVVSAQSDFILVPFDAQSLAYAVRRALRTV